MKKVFFPLFAVVIAIGGSAFTNAKVAGSIYGGTTDSDYSLRSTTSYQNSDCEDTSGKVCAYIVTEAGKLIVTAPNYTEANMATFKAAGYVTQAPGAKKGIYLLP